MASRFTMNFFIISPKPWHCLIPLSIPLFNVHLGVFSDLNFHPPSHPTPAPVWVSSLLPRAPYPLLVIWHCLKAFLGLSLLDFGMGPSHCANLNKSIFSVSISDSPQWILRTPDTSKPIRPVGVPACMYACL